VPLSGIRVVDLTRILAGPFCTMLLADMGAEVVKIETPGQGDPLRGQGVIRGGLSWYFAAFNRNKKSLTLNLRAEEGRAALARLIERSDVLVKNYRPGVLAAMHINPMLSSVPVVLISAMPESIVSKRCSGYATFLRKPFDFDAILGAVLGSLGDVH